MPTIKVDLTGADGTASNHIVRAAVRHGDDTAMVSAVRGSGATGIAQPRLYSRGDSVSPGDATSSVTPPLPTSSSAAAAAADGGTPGVNSLSLANSMAIADYNLSFMAPHPKIASEVLFHGGSFGATNRDTPVVPEVGGHAGSSVDEAAKRQPSAAGGAIVGSPAHRGPGRNSPKYNVRRNTFLAAALIPVQVAATRPVAHSPMSESHARSAAAAAAAGASSSSAGRASPPSNPMASISFDTGIGTIASPASGVFSDAARGDLPPGGYEDNSISSGETSPQLHVQERAGARRTSQSASRPDVLSRTLRNSTSLPGMISHEDQQKLLHPLEYNLPCIARAFTTCNILAAEEEGESATTAHRLEIALQDHLCSTTVAGVGAVPDRLRGLHAALRREVSLGDSTESTGFMSTLGDTTGSTGTAVATSRETSNVGGSFNVERAIFLPPLSVAARALSDAEASAMQVQRHLMHLETMRAREVMARNDAASTAQHVSPAGVDGDTEGAGTATSPLAGSLHRAATAPAARGRASSTLTAVASADDLIRSGSERPSHDPDADGTGAAAATAAEYVCLVAYPVIPQGNISDVYNAWVLQASPSSQEKEVVLRHIMMAVVTKVALLHAEGRCHGSIKASNIFCTQHVIDAIKRIITAIESRNDRASHADPMPSTAAPTAASAAADPADGVAAGVISPLAMAFVCRSGAAPTRHNSGDLGSRQDPSRDGAAPLGDETKRSGEAQYHGGQPPLEWFDHVVLADGLYHETEHLVDLVRRAPDRYEEAEGTAGEQQRAQENLACLLAELEGNEMNEVGLYGLHAHDYIPPPEAANISRRMPSSAPLALSCRTIASMESDIWNIGLLAIHLADGGFPAWLRRQQQPTPVLQRTSWSKNFFLFTQACTHKNPAQRPSAAALRESPWFVHSLSASLTTGAAATLLSTSSAHSISALRSAEANVYNAAELMGATPTPHSPHGAGCALGGPLTQDSPAKMLSRAHPSNDASSRDRQDPHSARATSHRPVHLCSAMELRMDEARRQRDHIARRQHDDAFRAQVAAGVPHSLAAVQLAFEQELASPQMDVAQKFMGEIAGSAPKGREIPDGRGPDNAQQQADPRDRRYNIVDRLLVAVDEIRGQLSLSRHQRSASRADERDESGDMLELDPELVERQLAALDQVGDALLELNAVSETAVEALFVMLLEAVNGSDELAELLQDKEQLQTALRSLYDASEKHRRPPARDSGTSGGQYVHERVQAKDRQEKQQQQPEGFSAPELVGAGGKALDGHRVSVGPQPREFANYEYCKWRMQSSETLRTRKRRSLEAFHVK